MLKAHTRVEISPLSSWVGLVKLRKESPEVTRWSVGDSSRSSYGAIIYMDYEDAAKVPIIEKMVMQVEAKARSDAKKEGLKFPDIYHVYYPDHLKLKIFSQNYENLLHERVVESVENIIRRAERLLRT